MKNLRLSLLLLFFITLITSSCTQKGEVVSAEDQDHLIMSVLWFQKSAEMRALYIQGYNIASERLVRAASLAGSGKPKAVVADIDETILDNSPFEGHLIETGKPYSVEAWKGWTNMAAATSLPGALKFAKLADSLGIELFYVSNRMINGELESTIENLKSEGFPFADKEHLLLKDSTSSKIERRNMILKNYDIVLLIGDNLADLDSVFERRPIDYGFADVDSLSNQFGERFIVLPNPMYGIWDKPAIIPAEKMTLRERMKKSIISWHP